MIKDQAGRREELPLHPEQTKQFRRGTRVRVYRGVGVRRSTQEAGEVTPGDPVEGRANHL